MLNQLYLTKKAHGVDVKLLMQEGGRPVKQKKQKKLKVKEKDKSAQQSETKLEPQLMTQELESIGDKSSNLLSQPTQSPIRIKTKSPKSLAGKRTPRSMMSKLKRGKFLMKEAPEFAGDLVYGRPTDDV